jgi:beta-glucosidase
VSNTGNRGADEVIQIYISKDDRASDDPVLSLKAFRRVFIPAGKSITVDFELNGSAFETVNGQGDFLLVPGSYAIIAADAAPAPVSVEKGCPAPVSAKINVK